ncbi:MAG TPA: glycosyltransferase family 39 protein, partial [Thermomicrobiales bacterium]|nr:glycosyltransferase family 39 protein [Thermomicrobiales bacterium]
MPSAAPIATDTTRTGTASRRTPRVALQDWLWLLTAMLLSLALRIPFFGIPMIPDEGGYAYATQGWMDGTGKLYHDLWISRPQGIFLVYGAIMETLGDGTYAFRFAAWIAIALTTIAVWLFARMWINPTVANVAAILFAVLSSSPNLEGFTANAEIFMGLPAAFAAVWLLQISRKSWSPWQLCGVGVLVGLATILKPSGVVMLPVAWGFILMIRQEQWRVHLKRCSAVFAGVMLVAIPTIINGITLGWHQFLYATVTYRLFQQSSASVGLSHNVTRLLSVSFQIWPMLALLLAVLAVAHRETIRRWIGRAPELVANGNRAMGWQMLRKIQSDVTIGLITPAPVRLTNLQRPTDDAGIILRLWVFGCLGGIAMGGDWWSHYLIQIAAPAAIWLGMISTRITIDLAMLRKRVAFVAMAVLLLGIPYRVLTDGSVTAMAE